MSQKAQGAVSRHNISGKTFRQRNEIGVKVLVLPIIFGAAFGLSTTNELGRIPDIPS
jgi:hypothetical protein